MKKGLRRWITAFIGGTSVSKRRKRNGQLLAAELLESRLVPSASWPFVESIDRTAPPGPITSDSAVSYTVTFSKPVTGVTASAFGLSFSGSVDGTIGPMTPVNGSVYDVSVESITGSGTLGLNLVDNNS